MSIVINTNGEIMELSLRKARKLESKILTYVTKLRLDNEVEVRVMARDGGDENNEIISQGREKFLQDAHTRVKLIRTRFGIRKQIAQANEHSGINDLINEREMLQALLATSLADLDVLDVMKLNDQIIAKKAHLEKGGVNTFGDAQVTIKTSVITKFDQSEFMEWDVKIQKELEEIEDQLSQKNMGIKIKLSEDVVNLLQSVGLV